MPVPDHVVVPLSYLGSLYQGCHCPHFLPGKRCGTENFPSCCHQQSVEDNMQTAISCRTYSIMGTDIHMVYTVFAGRTENAGVKRSRLH